MSNRILYIYPVLSISGTIVLWHSNSAGIAICHIVHVSTRPALAHSLATTTTRSTAVATISATVVEIATIGTLITLASAAPGQFHRSVHGPGHDGPVTPNNNRHQPMETQVCQVYHCPCPNGRKLPLH